VKDIINGLIISTVSVLAPIQAVMLTVGALIVFDLVTGVMAARKRGEVVKSAALRRTVSKLVIYQIAVISAFLVETFLLKGALPISKITAGIIGTVELTSIFENVNTVYGSNIFKKVLGMLGSTNDKDKK